MINTSAKTTLLTLTAIFIVFSFLSYQPEKDAIIKTDQTDQQAQKHDEPDREISGRIKKGETFFDIFKRHGLSVSELFLISEASAATHNISRLYTGRPYFLKLDAQNRVRQLSYQINDNSKINITLTNDGYLSNMVPIEYTTKRVTLHGSIINNLSSAIGNDLLALELSDIFAWDIDFTTDLRTGDSYTIAVEEMWLEGKRIKYGDILAAKLQNNGTTYNAYLFKHEGRKNYYDASGGSLRKSLLKAPLSYRRISSRFSFSRYHPILKKYRPHLGVDYSAATGTPVSSVGDGTIQFAGRKGPNGKLVIIKHSGGFTTYYGHLHRIARGIRKGARVSQGQVIGQVGSTGRATGPHLDYRIKLNGRFVNPLKLSLPKGAPIRDTLMSAYSSRVSEMDALLEANATENYVDIN